MKCRLKSMIATITVLVLTATIIVGCGKTESNSITTSEEVSAESSGEDIMEVTTEQDTEKTTESATTEIVTTESEPETTSEEEITTESETTTQIPTTVAPTTEAPKPTEKPTEKQKEKVTEKQTEKATEKPTKKEETTTSYWAMQEDASAIATKVIEYINAYRVKEGTFKVVQGTKELQKFADYRAKQLRHNYKHDRKDTLAAVKALNYGEFWSDGYYQPFHESTEAIHHILTSGEIDFVAKTLVDDFYASKGHWAYLGNMNNAYSELKYIAVGLYYDKCEWYCAIWMDSEQHTGPIYMD